MKIAIAGAIDSLGQDVIEQLIQLNRSDITIEGFDKKENIENNPFPIDESLEILELDNNSFADADIIVLASPEKDSSIYSEAALKSEANIIDSSGTLMSNDTPLVLHECNIDEAAYSKKVIINPNPLAQQLAKVLFPIQNSEEIKRVTTSTYQSVSGRGNNAISELFEQSSYLLNGKSHPSEITEFSTQIGFNCIPATSSFINENSKEELQLINQTQIVLKKRIPISATCVQVPTFIGYAQSVSIEFESPIDAAKIRQILDLAEGVAVIDDPKNNQFSTPYGCAETSTTYVSRIRKDYSSDNIIHFWIASDNLKTSAHNIVNIIKHLSSN